MIETILRTAPRHAAILSAIFIILLPRVEAQITSGLLQGTIHDESGAVIPGVLVRATNTETGLAREITSDERGRHLFPSLPVGRYEVRVELLGFHVSVEKDVALAVGDAKTLDFKLKIGSVALGG